MGFFNSLPVPEPSKVIPAHPCRLWHDVDCARESHVLCIVMPTTIKGKWSIPLEGNRTSSINIWWKHNSSEETGGDDGIKVSWQLNNSQEVNDDEETAVGEAAEFWKKSMSTLQVYTQKNTTWYQAESVCVSIGGHLVSITSKTEHEDVKNFLAGRFWLGGSDEATEGNWTWSDGKSWKEEHWNEGEKDG